MDDSTLTKICLENSVLRIFFCGVVQFEYLCADDYGLTNEIGNFLICNVANQHWFALQYRKNNTIAIFDSLEGKLLPRKQRIRKVLQSDFKVQNVLFILPKKLQNKNSLFCGEHTLYWLLHQSEFLLLRKHFDDKYSKRIIAFCHKKKISPDYFVWNEIYRKLRLAAPPNLEKVLTWANYSDD